MRGDRPQPRSLQPSIPVFTPHARGSTLFVVALVHAYHVYPACAGIDPIFRSGVPGNSGLPRMRGDRPALIEDIKKRGVFTPHARGSTRQEQIHLRLDLVYPACAGIDLLTANTFQAVIGLPRMRGDRPNEPERKNYERGFTPHARGSTS